MKIYTTLVFALLFSCNAFSQDLDAPQKPNIPFTEITFEETDFNFGIIDDGEVIQNVFKFTNTGDEPLIITNAKGSCGCTVPEWPKAPIMPGESSYLLVQFNSKNKKGKQAKRVTLTANTDPAQTFLVVRGEIINDDSEIAHKAHDEKPFDLAGKLSADNIQLYPNPTSNTIKLKIDEHHGKSAYVEVYNSLGERTYSKQVDKLTDQEIEISVSDHVAGTYVASIKIDGMHRIAKQFIVMEN